MARRTRKATMFAESAGRIKPRSMSGSVRAGASQAASSSAGKMTGSVLSNHHDVGHRSDVVAGAVVDTGSKAKPLDERSRGRCQEEATTHDSMYLRLGFLKAMPEGFDYCRRCVVRMNPRSLRLDRLHKGAISLP